VPEAAARIARDFMGDDGGGPWQVARELVGSRLNTALAAVRGCTGDVAACGSPDWFWVWAAVADASAVADALDALLPPAAAGWRLGGWDLRLVDEALVATLGDVPAAAPRPPARPGLWLEVPAAALEAHATTAAGGSRLRLDLRLPRSYR
jgi:hypothetical protein